MPFVRSVGREAGRSGLPINNSGLDQERDDQPEQGRRRGKKAEVKRTIERDVGEDNDKLSAVNSLAWGSDWTLLTKDESPAPATFMGIAFDLDTTGGKWGGWSLDARDVNGASQLNLPVEFDVVVVLKASNRFAAYLFDDAVFDGTDGGTWSIAFENQGGQIPRLSHMSFYVRIDEDGGIPSAIPEARTSAMMLAGLGLVGFMAWRRARTVA